MVKRWYGIERDADWCGQGKNNYFFEGCGTSTCPYGTLAKRINYVAVKVVSRNTIMVKAQALSCRMSEP